MTSSRQAAAIARARRQRQDAREVGVRPGLARTLGLADTAAPIATRDHAPDACDVFGCEICIALANRGAA